MKKVAVFCSSRADLPDGVVKGAQIISEAFARAGAALVYGGVDAGLMHSVAQTVADSQVPVIGVVPEVFAHRADSLCSQIVATSDLNTRKAAMIELADIFVVLPGGIGTIDEWISTLSHIMVSEKIDPSADKPILVWNHNHMYDGIVRQLNDTALSPYARGKRLNRSLIFDTPESLAHTLVQLLCDGLTSHD